MVGDRLNGCAVLVKAREVRFLKKLGCESAATGTGKVTSKARIYTGLRHQKGVTPLKHVVRPLKI